MADQENPRRSKIIACIGLALGFVWVEFYTDKDTE